MADVEVAGSVAPVRGERVETSPSAVDSPYAWYVLVVLLVVYTLSWMDRTILSIVAEDLKVRFALTDAELGFLHGTAFGVFYALFGYPLGRLVDRWVRVRLLAICLAAWSAMTVFCGLASSVPQLVAARIGVGIGEAAASPAGFSLVSDWFSRTKRGTALGIYIAGLYVGQGLALAIGGYVIYLWAGSALDEGWFGLQRSQAAFLIVGVPGILTALWVASMREPKRGLSDGIDPPREERVWSRFFGDVASVVPPFTLYQTARCGMGTFVANIVAAAAIVAAAWFLIRLTGDSMQWIVVAIGYYAAFSSAQILRKRDPATFALTWKTPAFVLSMIGFGVASMLNVNMGFWTAPLALRTLPVDAGTVGAVLGVTSAVCGMLGVTIGGRLSDYMLRVHPAGRLFVGLAATAIPVPFVIVMCLTREPLWFFLAYVPVVLVGTMWIAAGAAAIQELVLPRMRGTATITYFLASTLLGSALTPYIIGKISTARASLADGMLAALATTPIAIAALVGACFLVQRAEATKLERARAAGETNV